MASSIGVTFTLTKEEVVTTARFRYVRSQARKAAVIGGFVAVVLAALLAFEGDYVIVPMAVVLLFFGFVFPRLIGELMWRQSAPLRSEQHLVITNEGLKSDTPSGTLDVPWSNVQESGEIDAAFFLVPRKATRFFVVPKRVMTSEDMTYLRGLLEQRVHQH